jgi:NitT/TauT family transport system substrate-binding protein
MKLRKRIIAGSLAAVIAVMSLTGCGKDNKKQITTVNDDGTVSYTLAIGESGDAALNNPLIQLAEEKGYFAENNLTLTRTKLENNGAVMYDALSVGKIDAAYAQVVPPISYGAQGYNVTLFAGVLSGGMVAVCLPENYEKLKDISNWKAHSIGVVQMSTSELTTRDALKDYGLSADDVEYVMIEDYASIALSTSKGNVDIGFIGSNYVDQALEEGCVVLTTLYDIKKDYVCCRQSAYSKSLQENRDAYVYYLEAQIKAYKDINTDEDGTVSSLAKATGETEDYIYTYVYDEEGSAHRTYNPDPNYNGVSGLYEIMKEQKYVESDLTLDQFYDLSIYADALKNVIADNPDDEFYQNMKQYFKENNSGYPDFDNKFGDSFWEVS